SNVGGMTFMVPLALGMAASIRVGFNVGADDLPGARLSGWVAIYVSLVFAAIAAVVVFFSRDFIASLYSTELPVLILAVDLLLFIVVYQFFDDAQVTAMGALRGFKDTRTPMWVAIVAYWFIGLPIGVAIGTGWLPVAGFEGVKGFWVGLVVGLVVASVILVSRFRWLSSEESHIRAFATR
ncbi:MAG: MATE family efflux transporter, partial [Gammaproteobacteria bacterium]|nr:MATE family efflux transporter [Gammaproteobacteria bacterium]